MSKKHESESQAIVKLESQYPIFGDESAKITAIMKRNFGGDLSPADLDRIKIPSGGGLTFTIPSVDGDKTASKIQCIILYKKERQNNAYWATEYSGDNVAPDCSSDDGISGVGLPGGKCKTCPHNQFESDPRGGKGKACQNRQFIFPLLPGDYIPYAISLPPTSLGANKKYGIRLGQKGLQYIDVITEISLEAVKGQGVPEYSRAVFQVAKDENGKPLLLSPEEVARLEALVFNKGGMKDAFEAVKISPDDIESGGIE